MYRRSFLIKIFSTATLCSLLLLVNLSDIYAEDSLKSSDGLDTCVHVKSEKMNGQVSPSGVNGTIMIQKLIDDCHARGGGMVVVPPGEHICAPIRLRSNVQLHLPAGGTRELASRIVPEDEKRYPEQFFFGELPSWGFYLRHVENVRLENARLRLREMDGRPAGYLEDVVGLTQDRCEAILPDFTGTKLRQLFSE
jgi:hypothetical protein